jgi:putative hydrolase of the HAD superfamily
MTRTGAAPLGGANAGAATPPRVVVFDLGGVVIRICRTWKEGCDAAGVDHRPQAEQHLRSPGFRALIDRHQRGQLECAQFHAQLSQALGGVYAAHELEAIHNAWTRGDYPGIADAIDRMHAAGVETACLSNTSASHWELLKASQALQRIRHRHASHLLGLVKPDAAIYRAFEQATGFAPADILFFDDLEENIAGAHACGWNAVRIDHEGDTAAQVLAALRRAGVGA